MGRACKVRVAREPEAIDRLLTLGYGPAFVAARWGLKRHLVKRHRDRCLVGERRAKAEAWIRRQQRVNGGYGEGSEGDDEER